jgi:hypothetical protein
VDGTECDAPSLATRAGDLYLGFALARGRDERDHGQRVDRVLHERLATDRRDGSDHGGIQWFGKARAELNRHEHLRLLAPVRLAP